MSQVLYIQPDIEKLDTLLASIQEDVIVKTSLSVDKTELQSYARVGFLYHQDVAFPFVLDGDSGASSASSGYFSQAWLEYFAQSSQIIDLLTCEYEQDLAEVLKDVSVVATINYSTDTTGNTPIGDWILEKSINGNENVDVKAEYFTEAIQEWDVYLDNNTDTFVSFVIDKNNRTLSWGLFTGTTGSYKNFLFGRQLTFYDGSITPENLSGTDMLTEMITLTPTVHTGLTKTIKCGMTANAFLDLDNKLYMFGGQSNLKSSFTYEPQFVDPNTYFNGNEIVDFAFNYRNMLLLDSKGRIYADGINTDFRNTNSLSTSGFNFGEISANYFDEPIVKVISGRSNSAFINNVGEVYVVGNKNYNIFTWSNGSVPTADVGNGTPKKIPSSVFGGNKIVDVNFVHSMYGAAFWLDDTGKLYASGQINNAAQGSPYNLTGSYYLSQVLDVSNLNIKSISSNESNFCFVDASGDLYTLGSNAGGLTGIDLSLGTTVTFQKVTNPSPHPIFKAGYCNLNCGYIIDEVGDLYTFGAKYYNAHTEDKLTPTKVTLDKSIIQINQRSDPEMYPGIAYADVCFLENTLIQTDQGQVRIKDLSPKKHTIKNKKINYITQTKLSRDSSLIQVRKNALGENIPSKTTYMTKEHRILQDGKLIPSKYFPLWNNRVREVPYKNQILYNIVMDKHEVISANNMLTETLEPDHKIAKLYKELSSKTDEEKRQLVKSFNAKVQHHKRVQEGYKTK